MTVGSFTGGWAERIPASSRTILLRRALQVFCALGLSLACIGCRAPGMKMNMKASESETRTQINGVDIRLQPINARTIALQARHSADQTEASELTELLDTANAASYKIGPQDVLLVAIWDHPELTLPLGQYRTDHSTGTVVEDDGHIYYPHVGRIPVAGLTLPEIREKLTSALSKTIRNPQLDVRIMTFRSQKVYVGGEVRNPAVYPVTDVPFTLAEAIHRAGGFTAAADMSAVQLTRGKRQWTLSFQDLVSKGNLIDRIRLQNGDSIHVQHRDVAPVYMMGEIAMPRSLPMHNGRISLSQAISDAGGIRNETADARSIYVMRRGEGDNSVDVFHLDARNPTSMVIADRFQLRPRDLVYVDAGSLVRWSRVMALLMPTIDSVLGTTLTANDVKNTFSTF